MPVGNVFYGMMSLERVQNKRIPAAEARTLYPLLAYVNAAKIGTKNEPANFSAGNLTFPGTAPTGNAPCRASRTAALGEALEQAGAPAPCPFPTRASLPRPILEGSRPGHSHALWPTCEFSPAEGEAGRGLRPMPSRPVPLSSRPAVSLWMSPGSWGLPGATSGHSCGR